LKNIIKLMIAFLMFFSCEEQKENNTEQESDTDSQTETTETDAGNEGQTRIIEAVTENAYPPFNLTDPDTGEGIGFEYDITNEIANRLGFEVHWNASAWDTLIESVMTGAYEIGMSGISYTEERAKTVDYSSDSYVDMITTLLTRIDEDRFTDIDSLIANEELFIGTQVGTIQYDIAETYLKDQMATRAKTFDTIPLAVQALISGDVDAVLTEETAGIGYIGAGKDKLKTISDPLDKGGIYYIFTQGSDLKALFDAKLQELKDDGTLEKLTKKWFI